jgi:hypothetical protein
MTIVQHQFVSTGWSGGPGYTSFYMQADGENTPQQQVDALKTFFDAIDGELPTEVTYTSVGSYRTINETTGALVAITAYGTPPAATPGTGNATFAAPSGCVITWLTSAFGASKAIVGRTYIVPAGSNMFQNDGTLADADKAAVQTAAAALVTALSPDLLVWRRPVDGAGGGISVVTAARVADRVAILRSRRA